MKKKSNGNENMSASSSDEIFDLNKIPIEVLDNGYVCCSKYCLGTEENLNDKQKEAWKKEGNYIPVDTNGI